MALLFCTASEVLVDEKGNLPSVLLEVCFHLPPFLLFPTGGGSHPCFSTVARRVAVQGEECCSPICCRCESRGKETTDTCYLSILLNLTSQYSYRELESLGDDDPDFLWLVGMGGGWGSILNRVHTGVASSLSLSPTLCFDQSIDCVDQQKNSYEIVHHRIPFLVTLFFLLDFSVLQQAKSVRLPSDRLL